MFTKRCPRATALVFSGCWAFMLLLAPSLTWAQDSPVAFMLPSGNSALDATLNDAAGVAGWQVKTISWEGFRKGFENEAGDEQAVDASLLILPDAARLPATAIEAVTAYLDRGGNILALNAPAFRQILVPWHGKWGTFSDLASLMIEESHPTLEIPVSETELANWKRECRDASLPAEYRVVSTEKGPAIEARIPRMDGWDSLRRVWSSAPVFPPDTTALGFEARSIGNSEQLAVECQEDDGSRWIAVVPLGPDWKPYALLAADFRFWESVPARAGTCLDFRRVVSLAITQANTHTGSEMIDLGYQVRGIRGLRLESYEVAVLKTVQPPRLEGLSPEYKFYPCGEVERLGVTGWFEGLPVPPVPATVTAHHPRPSPAGFDKRRGWACEPLLEAWGKDGAFRGDVARLFVFAPGDKPVPGFAGGRGMILSFSVPDLDWYCGPESRDLLRRAMERLRIQAALVDGGVNRYTTIYGEPLEVGVTVALLDSRSHKVTADVRVLDRDGNALYHLERETEGTGTLRLADTWIPKKVLTDGVTAKVMVAVDGKALPGVEHELYTWTRPPEGERFVEIQNGAFWVDGKRWRPHGVNYMPSSGIGVEDNAFFEYWLSAQSYDPRTVQRDLERCRDMGFNAISVFLYYQDMHAMNLLDLLRRARKLGLRANVSLRPGTPMELERDDIEGHIWRAHQEPWRGFGDQPAPKNFAEMVTRMITRLALNENDTVFAYDLAWEPQFRDFEREPFYDEYEHWLVEQYGSLEAAEADWGCPVPRDANGRVVGYLPGMLTDPSRKWAPAIAAYRRFLDRLLYEKYAAVRRAVKQVAPRQFVSFRMSMAGDPTNRDPNTILYDFAYLAGAVDILEPEGYGRLGDWEVVKPGRFTRSYALWANPRIPMIWAEAGIHVWDGRRKGTTERALERQAKFYEDFYRMMIESGAEGVFWWWYPGGFRVNENSDYGVINPDGTDRPVTTVIRANAQRFQEGPSAYQPDAWLTFDRDACVLGLTGVYDELKESYWRHVGEGRCPGLKTEATGTTSVDVPALAVGNRPWTGQNPPKYLDVSFDEIVAFRPEPPALDLTRERIPVGGILGAAICPRLILVTLTNLGEATLRGGEDIAGKPGEVLLRIEVGTQTLEAPLIRNLARFESGHLEFFLPSVKPGDTVQARMYVRGRGPFGPLIRWEVR